eukprot:2626092-Prorocentrum_lima.AAC.1
MWCPLRLRSLILVGLLLLWVPSLSLKRTLCRLRPGYGQGSPRRVAGFCALASYLWPPSQTL